MSGKGAGAFAAAKIIADSQERVTKLLASMQREARCPSSMLFTGPEGSGKEIAALGFAAALNCGKGMGWECEGCPACSRVFRLEHPDVHILFPLPYGSSEKTLPVIMESRRENFFNYGEFGNRARSIGIDLIRGVIERVSMQPYEGMKTVVLVFEAHLATAQAQNSFLKLLEEPPESVVIVLVTEFPDRLLPTITSRCFKVRFDHLSPAAVEKIIAGAMGKRDQDAARTAALSEGNLRRAIRLQDDRFRRVSEGAIQAIGAVAGGDEGDIADLAESMARGLNREEVPEMLEELARNLRVINEEAGESDTAGGSLSEVLGRKAADSVKARNFPSDLKRISRAAEALRKNADTELALVQLFLDLAGKWY